MLLTAPPVQEPTTDALVKAAALLLSATPDLSGFLGSGVPAPAIGGKRIYRHAFPDWPASTKGEPHARLLVRSPILPFGALPLPGGQRRAQLIVRGEVAMLDSYDARRYLLRMLGIAQMALEGLEVDMRDTAALKTDVPAVSSPLVRYRSISEPEADGTGVAALLRADVVFQAVLSPV